MPAAVQVPKPLDIARRIRLYGEQLVLLDVDLADLFGVSVKRLVEVVLQSHPKLPVEIASFIGPDEIKNLMPRLKASHWSAGRQRVLAVTEHGVLVAGSMLNSAHAIETSIAIVRAFVKLREDDGLLALMTPGAPSRRELH